MRPSSRRLQESLKLLALPLSQRPPSAGKPPLFYLHAIKQAKVPTSSLTYASWATNKAADFWSKLGQADEKSWKRKAFVQGERFMDRIEYEEWALKAIDPALAPKPWSSSSSTSNTASTPAASTEATSDKHPIEALHNLPKTSGGAESGVQGGGEKKAGGKVTLLYPEALLEPGPMIQALKEQLEHREPHHKAAMWKCLLGAPLTFPFAIIPIVPNFPMFYVLWRAWSHWRAWKASAYLNSLLSASQISLQSSAQLDKIYATTPAGTDQLLTLDKVPRIVHAFSLNDDEKAELNRAVLQVESRLKTEAEKESIKKE